MQSLSFIALLASTSALKIAPTSDLTTLAQTQAEFKFGEDGEIVGPDRLSEDIKELGQAIGITRDKTYHHLLDQMANAADPSQIPAKDRVNDANIYTMLKEISDRNFDIMDKLQTIETQTLPNLSSKIDTAEQSLKAHVDEQLEAQLAKLLENFRLDLTLQLFHLEQRVKGLYVDEATFENMTQEQQAEYFAELQKASTSSIMDKTLENLAFSIQSNNNLKTIADGLGYTSVDLSDINFQSVFQYTPRVASAAAEGESATPGAQ
jgi:hypothetical protein